MKSNYHIFYESLIRASVVAIANDSAHFEGFLKEGRMSLLLEDFTNKDAQKLANSLKDQKKRTLEVIDALPDKMVNIRKLLDSLAGEIDGVSDTKEIATLAIKGNSKALKAKIENLNRVFMRVGNATAAVVETMINAADNLDAAGLSNDLKSVSLSDIEADLAETGATTASKEYQEVKKIMKAIVDSFDVPDWQKTAIEKGSSEAKSDAGGLWSAVKSFFGNLFAAGKEKLLDDAKGSFTKDLSTLTIAEIIKAKPAMETVRSALIGTVQTAAEETAVATADTAATANPQAAKAQLGQTPTPEVQARIDMLKKQKLINWQNMAKKAPKELADLVNQAAGEKILATEVKRWAQLAGIREDKK